MPEDQSMERRVYDHEQDAAVFGELIDSYDMPGDEVIPLHEAEGLRLSEKEFGERRRASFQQYSRLQAKKKHPSSKNIRNLLTDLRAERRSLSLQYHPWRLDMKTSRLPQMMSARAHYRRLLIMVSS
jgi:hypothetical protein